MNFYTEVLPNTDNKADDNKEVTKEDDGKSIAKEKQFSKKEGQEEMIAELDSEYYLIKKGDSLSKIVEKLGKEKGLEISVEELMALNSLKSSDIKTGDKLIIKIPE
jgi:LysM repeat protein